MSKWAYACIPHKSYNTEDTRATLRTYPPNPTTRAAHKSTPSGWRGAWGCARNLGLASMRGEEAALQHGLVADEDGLGFDEGNAVVDVEDEAGLVGAADDGTFLNCGVLHQDVLDFQRADTVAG